MDTHSVCRPEMGYCAVSGQIETRSALWKVYEQIKYDGYVRIKMNVEDRIKICQRGIYENRCNDCPFVRIRPITNPLKPIYRGLESPKK